MLRVLQEIHTDEYFTELEVEQLITADLDKPWKPARDQKAM